MSKTNPLAGFLNRGKTAPDEPNPELQYEGEDVSQDQGPLQAMKRMDRKRLRSHLDKVFNVAMVILIVVLLLKLYEVLTDEERKNLMSSPGDYYADYLGDDYSKLVVEIDYVEGYGPDTEALNHFQSILERECRKQVSMKLDDEIQSTDSSYTLKEINQLEERYRDHYRGGDSAVMYYLYLNGEFAESGNVVGVSYHGSSVALFQEKFEAASTGRISPMEVERAVLVHEAGHLFALVEINYESDVQHQDPNYPHHCDHTDTLGNHDCVMHWAIETLDAGSFDSYYNQAVGDVPNDFCEDCRADLQKLRNKA